VVVVVGALFGMGPVNINTNVFLGGGNILRCIQVVYYQQFNSICYNNVTEDRRKMDNKVLLVKSEVIDNFMDNYNKLDAKVDTEDECFNWLNGFAKNSLKWRYMKDLMSEIESKCVKETEEERIKGK